MGDARREIERASERKREYKSTRDENAEAHLKAIGREGVQFVLDLCRHNFGICGREASDTIDQLAEKHNAISKQCRESRRGYRQGQALAETLARP